MAATRLPDIQNHSSKIQLERAGHVYFEHPDLKAFESFAADFGLIEAYRNNDTILYRGYGRDPYCYVARAATGGQPAFGGGAFLAQTQGDFDKAAAMDGATVSDLSPFPGGGQKVTLKTPAGFPLHVVYGQKARTSSTSPPSAQVESVGPLNGSLSKHRFGRQCSRPGHIAGTRNR